MSIQTGNIEYNRVIRLTKNTKSFNDACNFYLIDLTSTSLQLTLQDSTTKDCIDNFESIILNPTLIESPTGSVSPNNSNENHVVIEFTLNKPTGSIPEGANWFVEWGDGYGEFDWFELNATDKTSDSTLSINIPY